MLRLVVYSPAGVRRLPMATGSLTVGSGASCDLILEDSEIPARHATLQRLGTGGKLLLSVLEGSPSVLVNGRVCREAELEPLDEIRLGNVTLLVEDSAQAGLSQAPHAGAAQPLARRAVGLPARMVEHLSRLSEWVANDSASSVSVESIVVRLLHDLGGGACFLFEGPLESSCGVKFAAGSEPHLVGRAEAVLGLLIESVRPDPTHSFGELRCELEGEALRLFYRRLSALERDYCVTFVVADHAELDEEGWSPVLAFSAVSDLLVLGLVHHVGRYEPILPGRDRSTSLILAPGLVLGPSKASEGLAAAMRAVGEGVNVLVRGEPGSGRELVARSLHLSTERRSEPFLVVECDEPHAKRLLADLVGAQIEGRQGPVRREGKLVAAGAGTVMLRALEKVPMEVQSVLARVLRSGEVQGPGELEVHPLRARLIASTSVDLEEACDRGALRRDVLLRIAQHTIAVPSLGERRDDLPLLLQTLVNRFSHETGKRVRGITVRALSLLNSYRFPGNLRELENVVRHMVYLAEPDTPMDVGTLPVQLRSAPPEHRTDPSEISGNHLRLTEVVGKVERNAIREALKQSEGNKSKAARLLGLSRNGLAQKMQRYGLAAPGVDG